jgi:hypothetical protein
MGEGEGEEGHLLATPRGLKSHSPCRRLLREPAAHSLTPRGRYMRRRSAPLTASALAALALLLAAAAAHPAAAQPPPPAPLVPGAASFAAQLVAPGPQQAPAAAPAPAVQPVMDPSLNRAGQPVLTPTRAELAGREVYYEVPQSPVGLLFFFHGCKHYAYDHWYPQPACPECRGARATGPLQRHPAGWLAGLLAAAGWPGGAGAASLVAAISAWPCRTSLPLQHTPEPPLLPPWCRPARRGVSHQAGAGPGLRFLRDTGTGQDLVQGRHLLLRVGPLLRCARCATLRRAAPHCAALPCCRRALPCQVQVLGSVAASPFSLVASRPASRPATQPLRRLPPHRHFPAAGQATRRGCWR